MVSMWSGPIAFLLVLIGALSTLPQRVFMFRLGDEFNPGIQSFSYATDHVNLINALDCLDPDVNILDVIGKEVDVMRKLARNGEIEGIPGPRVMKAPLMHAFVALGDEVGKVSEKSCIERAEAIVALEAQSDELNMANRLLEILSGFITEDSDPWYFLDLTERNIRQALYNEVNPGRAWTFKCKDAEVIFGKLRDIWATFLNSTSRENMKDFVTKLSFANASLENATSRVQRTFNLALQHEFPEKSSCSPFSQVSLRLARFASCFSSSGLLPKSNDKKLELMKEWGRGMYTRSNVSWPLVSRAAAKAVEFRKSWHDHVLNLIQKPDTSAPAFAKCAAKLFPIGVDTSEPQSSSSQENQARTLRCLPALLNWPGFHGVVMEEEGRVSLSEEAFVVDKQCVMPPVCGRLGAAVLTAWQTRNYGGAGHILPAHWRFENSQGMSETVLGDCMDINSTKSFVCYDYSHYCFPQIMRYLCHTLPSCCPSLHGHGAASECSALSAEEFAKDNSACDVCRQPSHFGGVVTGGSTMNWLKKTFSGQGPLENEIRRLAQA